MRNFPVPEHPLAGLLWRVLQRNHLAWLREAIPEDFYQECALFLSQWPDLPDDRREFFRAAGRHFYRVAVNYGLIRKVMSIDYNRYNRTATSKWVWEKIEFCKKILLSGESGWTDWYLFQGYLSGLNLNELAFLTFGELKAEEVKDRLREIIRRIREAAGVDPNLPLPPMPKGGKVEFRQGPRMGAGSRPNPAKPRQWVWTGVKNLPLGEIMRQFGVSRTTAWRIRRRGWFVPNYHKKEERRERNER